MKLLGLALFFSLDKTHRVVFPLACWSSPLAVYHTSPRPVLMTSPPPVESEGPAYCAPRCEHCQLQDRHLSALHVQAVSDTPWLLRPAALPATWLPQPCHSPHTRTHGAWLETVALFSSTDSKPNGFHHVCYCVTSILPGGKHHKTLTRVPVAAWGTGLLGCCWAAGGLGPHGVLPLKSCPRREVSAFILLIFQ